MKNMNKGLNNLITDKVKMNRTVNIKRLDYIDIAKSLGMLTIIWGHIIHYGWPNQIVYAFHIPLFFFLSGMVFKAEKYPTVWDLIKKRTKTLLLPYLIFSLITWALWVAMRVLANDSTNYWFPLLQTFIAQGSGGYLRHNLPLWFVSCLFAVEILYYWINKLPKLCSVLACIILSVFGCYMSAQGIAEWNSLPWSFDGTLICLLFYASGHWLIEMFPHNELQSIVNSKKVLCVGGIILLMVLLYFSSVYNGYVTIGSNKIGNNIALFYLNSYVGIFIMIVFCICLGNTKFNTNGGIMLSYLKWFGQNSFYAMATHFPIKEALGRIVNKVFYCDVHYDIKYAALVFILTLIIDSIVVWGCCWIKDKWNKRTQKYSFS